MIGLVPSILSADFTRLGEQVREAEAGGAQRIQILRTCSRLRFTPSLSIVDDVFPFAGIRVQ